LKDGESILALLEKLENSKMKVVFVANCLLNQFMRARGVKNVYKVGDREKAIVEPLLDLFKKYDVAIEQLPCIEVLYEGLIRKAGGQNRYNTVMFRDLCTFHAKQIVKLIKEYLKAGIKVCCIIGVDGSPTCGVTLTSLGFGKWARDKGIFMKILEEMLRKEGINIPFIGMRMRKPYEFENSLKEIEKIIKS